MKSKEEVNLNPKATFYAVLYADFQKVALECGYALSIHGSMSSDMDLIAVPWVEDAQEPAVLAAKISDRIGDTVWKQNHHTEFEERPHNRLAYTLAICGDWYIDLSIMKPIKPVPAQLAMEELISKIKVVVTDKENDWVGQYQEYFAVNYDELKQLISK